MIIFHFILQDKNKPLKCNSDRKEIHMSWREVKHTSFWLIDICFQFAEKITLHLSPLKFSLRSHFGSDPGRQKAIQREYGR